MVSRRWQEALKCSHPWAQSGHHHCKFMWWNSCCICKSSHIFTHSFFLWRSWLWPSSLVISWSLCHGITLPWFQLARWSDLTFISGSSRSSCIQWYHSSSSSQGSTPASDKNSCSQIISHVSILLHFCTFLNSLISFTSLCLCNCLLLPATTTMSTPYQTQKKHVIV